MNPWNTEDAVAVCCAVETICPAFGCHVALTGGCLYRHGDRKDLDILFYRIRQVSEIDMPKLIEGLKAIGFSEIEGWGWCYKAKFNGRSVDMFFPEEQRGKVYKPPEHHAALEATP